MQLASIDWIVIIICLTAAFAPGSVRELAEL